MFFVGHSPNPSVLGIPSPSFSTTGALAGGALFSRAVAPADEGGGVASFLAGAFSGSDVGGAEEDESQHAEGGWGAVHRAEF